MKRLWALIPVVVMIALPALAQDYTRAFEAITELNAMSPVQNPSYRRANDILTHKVIDSRNKVVGEINDVMLSSRGTVTALNIDFNRIHLGDAAYISYKSLNIRPATNGYILGFNREQIETLFPTLLAETETAAGSETDLMPLSKLIGTSLRSQDGRKVGRIDDVLFSNQGTNAEALYVTLQEGNLRGETLAIPFGDVRIETGMINSSAIISNDVANAALEYAKTH